MSTDAQVGPDTRTLTTNEEVRWDDFDPQWYCQHNYGKLRDDDREILGRMADFFGKSRDLLDHRNGPWGDPRRLLHGVDVGAGANLYPTLAMLPFCHQITLFERAKSNCRWLRKEVESFSTTWEPYWAELATRRRYESIDEARWTVHERVQVENGSIFDLPRRTYDIGTMFFVAESITTWHEEFHRATESFLGSLRPEAPFAAAFMRSSSGYVVRGVPFPAVAVDEDDVQESLTAAGIKEYTVWPISSATPLRKDVGMILVTGTVPPR